MFLQTNKIKGILSFLIYCLACSSSMIYSDPSNHPSIQSQIAVAAGYSRHPSTQLNFPVAPGRS